MADRLVFSPSGHRFKTNNLPITDGALCAYEQKVCDIYDRPNFTMSGINLILKCLI